MSNISTLQRLRESAKVQETISVGWRLIIAIILISVVPMFYEWLKARRESKLEKPKAEVETP